MYLNKKNINIIKKLALKKMTYILFLQNIIQELLIEFARELEVRF